MRLQLSQHSLLLVTWLTTTALFTPRLRADVLPDAPRYVVVHKKWIGESREFNHLSLKTREIQVVAPRLVIGKGHANGIFESLNGQEDIEHLTLSADELVIRSTLHLPGTRVHIYADAFVFEGDGAIVTTPLDFGTAPEPVGKDGNPALDAGNI